MRITAGTKYNQMNYYQNHLQNKLNEANTKIASGNKIQYGYQSPDVYDKNLKLEYDTNTLDQGIDLANNAYTYTLNTDKALGELSEVIATFNTKLLQAANEGHSSVSRDAIAMELEKLKKHMINIGNTSIGGKFIFGGSRTDVAPFTPDGRYIGNDEKMKALISSRADVPFNITGQQLFLSRDNDVHRQLTTNIKKYNLTKLHPSVMSATMQTAEPKEVYITAGDTLRDLIGDNDADTTNNNPEFFYLSGIRTDGSAFKSKFSIETNYTNEENAAKVQDLLDKIGREFGNNATNKVVEVSLSNWGQIEIKSLVKGNSNIEFNLVSSAHDVDDLNDFAKYGYDVTSYMKSPFVGDFENSTIKNSRDKFDHRDSFFSTPFVTEDNQLAGGRTKLKDILRDGVSRLEFSATRPNNSDGTINPEPYPAPFIYDVGANDSVDDLMNALKKYLNNSGSNLDVTIENGIMHFRDENIKKLRVDDKFAPYDGPNGFSITMTTKAIPSQSFISQYPEGTDAAGYVKVKGLRNSYKVTYDHTFFTNKGSKLVSNVAQIEGGLQNASSTTKLSEVAQGNLNDKTFKMQLKDHNGVELEARIWLDSRRGAFLILPNRGTKPHETGLQPDVTFDKSVLKDIDGILEPKEFYIPLFDSNTQKVSNTRANDVTYRQLMDAIAISLNYSNITQSTYKAVNAPPPEILKQMNEEYELTYPYEKMNVTSDLTLPKKHTYENLLKDATAKIGVNLDVDGKIEIADLSRGKTRMQFSLYDDDSQNFSQQQVDNQEYATLRFNANDALIIDTPEINFFAQIDKIIRDVKMGIYRPDAFPHAYNESMRDIGIQNSITQFNHLSNHVERMVAQNGSQSRSFQDSIRRNEVLKVQVSSIKNDVIGADLAKTYNEFNSLSNNYNAALSSTSRIANMSLVDHLR